MHKWMLPFLLATAVGLAVTPQEAEQRAAKLVAQMTLPEKIGQMQDRAPAIPRLGIPEYGWWNEALHGVARNGLATVFPQAIGLAATWDPDLEFRMAEIISTEARAKYNEAIKNGQHRRYQGLTFWSPNINIFRDPRWGRGQETYGEDPLLTATMANAFIRGLQGSDPNFLKTIATSKHFAVHSGPETGRHSFDAQVSDKDLDGTYLRAFQSTIEQAGVASLMCAYNRVNGAPACASTDLLDKHLRRAWHFGGYVVSDCGAVGDIFEGHHYASSMAEASAKAVKAGTDLDCGTEYSHLAEAVQQGLISEKEIDRAVTRLMTARIRLGMFEEPGTVPFDRIGTDQIASDAHAKVALEAAEKSMVLLKNNGVLPWDGGPRNLAVIGPAADDPDTMLGNYYGTPPRLVTPLAGLQAQYAKTGKVSYALGSLFVDSMPALISREDIEGGVTAEYFANPDLKGEPALTRTEERAYFVWAMNDRNIQRALPQPTFSVRFTLKLRPRFSGDFRVGVGHQECDSCLGNTRTQVFVENKLLIDETRKSATGSGVKTEAISLEKGKTYQVRVEYRQQQGGSGVELVWQPPAEPLLSQAISTARSADAVVLCLGLNSRLEGEESRVRVPGFSGGDRTDLNLPAGQQNLLGAILDTGKPTVVVLLNGSALAVNDALQRASAVLEAWYPGQEGGTAIAETLSGHNNPAGRLPITFYRSVSQLPEFTDYRMENRTYRYFNGKVLLPFGYGLSYSEFQYEKLPEGSAGRQARVRNTSKRDGDEVVQLYESLPNGHWQLAGFKRIHLRAGEAQTVSFPAGTKTGTRWEIAGKQPSAAQNLRTTNAARP